MKKQNLQSILVLSLLLVAGSAFAQTINVRSDVPFSFKVAGKNMPAGQYSIRTLTADGETLAFRDPESRTVALVHSNSAQKLERSNATKLVFHVYGSEYFLSEIWVEGSSDGHQIPVSSRERELAKGNTALDVNVLAQVQ